jgi:BirA family biotin operon repressor/biotin-[acetyl-CoA-carboxylase] ligase
MTSRALLEAFHRASGGYVHRAAPAAVAELQALGYRIESHPHHGYRLLSSPDRLTADDIKAQLKPQLIGAEILVFEQTASTNDIVATLAAAGAREGLVVFAETQTKGRGRHHRAWASPRGKGLWFSVLLRPALTPDAFPRLTVAASVAVVRAIRQLTALDPRIKWPNDVIIRRKKIAGILVETFGAAGVAAAVPAAFSIASGTDATTTAILGIGINANCARADFPPDLVPLATSLALETGQRQDRATLAAAVLTALDDCYRRALADFDSVVTEWAGCCDTLGRQLTVKMGRRRIEGHAQALDADGALLLRKDNGQIERILGADVETEK